MNKRKAIEWKYPDLAYKQDYKVVNEGESSEIFEWNTTKYPEPSDSEIAEWFGQYSYLESRRYEALEDQCDKLWHDVDNGLFGDPAKAGEWYLSIKAVKDAAPKPEA